MSVKTFDYKKEYKDLYLPKEKPVLIDVPAMNFIMADGSGDPNNNPDFEQAVEVLYVLSYAIKMSKMKAKSGCMASNEVKRNDQLPGYFEYVVPPP